MKFAKEVLDSISGQDITFLDWIRDIYLIYTDRENKVSEIVNLFNNEGTNYMTIITSFSLNWLRYHRNLVSAETGRLKKFGTEILEELNKSIGNFINNIGVKTLPDDTDSYYLLCDAIQFIGIIKNLSECEKAAVSKITDKIVLRNSEIANLPEKIVKEKKFAEFKAIVPM